MDDEPGVERLYVLASDRRSTGVFLSSTRCSTHGAGERPPALPAGRRVQLPREDDRFFRSSSILAARMDDSDNPGVGVERLYVLASDRRIDISEFFSLESGRQREGRRQVPWPRTDRPGGDGSIEDDVLDQLNARLASWAGNAFTEFADEDALAVSSYGVGRPERPRRNSPGCD